jgi:hypothetical protein
VIARALRTLAGWLLPVALGLVLLEAVTRIVAPQVLQRDVPDLWEPDARFGWRRRPHMQLVANTGDRDVALCTDAERDRVACPPPPPRACGRRVLVVGDSFVEALAIPWEQTAWARLEADTGACLDVAGVAAYGVAQYALLAEDRLAGESRFDLVLVSLYVENDLTDDSRAIPKSQEVARHPLRLLPDGLSQPALWRWAYPYNQWLESRSHAYVGLRAAIRRQLDRADVGMFGVPAAVRPSRFAAATARETAAGVFRIADAARARGARTLVSLLPYRNQVIDPAGDALLEALPELAGDLDMDLPQKRLVPILAERVTVVDLLAGMRAEGRADLWGERDRHLSPEGHRVWFELLRAPVRGALELAP